MNGKRLNSTCPEPVRKYLRCRAAAGPWSIEGTDRDDFLGAVVIPSLAEGASLFATLASLAANPLQLLERFLVVVVVNHRQDAGADLKEQNRRDLQQLAAGDHPSGLVLARVDAASPGRELPIKGGGVGLARKVGFDLALSRLDYSGSPPILVSLDADTLLRADYLPALLGHFARAKEGGAVLPFRHQPGATSAEEAAIGRYELFLRHYVLGLTLAGSPYAYHTVGSALACSASAYVQAGGMNRRTAGEDFYFLQQLARTSGVARLAGTVVFPSPRPSGRTPFGTGRSVARLLAGERRAVLFYPPEAFAILGSWLALAAAGWQEEAESLLGEAHRASPALATFLRGENFPLVWNRFRLQHRSREAFFRAFHGWFDALRTLRLIHALCEGEHPRLDPEVAVPTLLARSGLEPAAEPERQLELLRHQQEDGNFSVNEGQPEGRSFFFARNIV